MSRVAVIRNKEFGLTETFILAHEQHLPAAGTIVHQHGNRPTLNGQALQSRSFVARGLRRLSRSIRPNSSNRESTAGFVAGIRRIRADVVLAEYGFMGVAVMEACRILRVPLVVHFHGIDAHGDSIVCHNRDSYQELFASAVATVAVSKDMKRQLMSLGCPASKIVVSPYGVDCERFSNAQPGMAPPVLVAVGRMVEKKGLHLTLLAFAEVLRAEPDAQLRIVGDGRLFGVCQDIVQSLAIERSVKFLGAQNHEVVQQEMRNARGFVQHSIRAADGDSEGCPVAVLEASASGLPVVATRHAGIADVVVDEETGLLMDERDVQGMSRKMLEVIRNPQLAGELGARGAARVRMFFTMDQSIGRLRRVLNAAAEGGAIDSVRDEIEAELFAPPIETSTATLTYDNRLHPPEFGRQTC